MSFNLKPRHCLSGVSFCLPFWATGTLLCLVKLLKSRSVNKLKKGCLLLGGSSPQAALPWILLSGAEFPVVLLFKPPVHGESRLCVKRLAHIRGQARSTALTAVPKGGSLLLNKL